MMIVRTSITVRFTFDGRVDWRMEQQEDGRMVVRTNPLTVPFLEGEVYVTSTETVLVEEGPAMNTEDSW